MTDGKRVQLFSSGGGVQSTAIAALICMEKLRPDAAIIVDTEREQDAVWEYLERWVRPALKMAGIEIHRIAKSEFSKLDVWGGAKGEDLLIPAFTDINGSIGKLPTFCSNEWKKRVVRRWAKSRYPERTKFNTWIGFSTDEIKRVYQEPGRWHPIFPLIDLRMSRGDCYRTIERMQWPVPPKSSCWMCPNRDHAAWIEMKHQRPEEWQKAVDFERQIRLRDDCFYLHPQGVTLDKVSEIPTTGDLFTGRCDSGYCHT